MVFFPIFAIAQAPQKINFQSVLRNTTGEVVSNKAVSLRISILSGIINDNSVYIETHAKTTDASGLISLQIGNGTVISGIFANIDWGGASHFIKLEADFSGGSNYVVLGTQELMSVPYALYATKTDTSELNLTSRLATKLTKTDTASLSNRIDFKLTKTDPGQNGQALILVNGIPSWSTLSTSVTDIDGNIYGTVQIGNQVWMSENLKTSRNRNGDLIPIVTDNTAWGALTTHWWSKFV